ncbi:MAG: hypothetical protein HOC23_17485 [Halieaceae bacterium]|jgi:putative dimethyl sulfoxide reductase chaperone|nr:hypothetical protein [Halieaceae bacterium]
MVPDQPDESSAGEVAARSQIYQCFAIAFSHPTDDFLDDIFSGDFLSTLILLGSRLPYATPFNAVEEDALRTAELSRAMVSTFYTSQFESGGHTISLRESGYSSMTEKALMEDVFRFYRFFGLDLSGSVLRESPDNLSVELEFLHYLTYLESRGGEAPAAQRNSDALRRGQRDFIQQHPGSWLGPFCARLKGIPDSAVYAYLAGLLQRFIDSEERFLSSLLGGVIAKSR